MRHIKKAISYSIAGSLGLTVIASLQGCSDNGSQTPNLSGFDSGQGQNLEQNYFIVMRQTGTAPDTYELVEKHPTEGPTRAILRLSDGTERFMSADELKRIAEEEAARVEAGTSRLTEDPSMHSGGLSMGEMLLATAAGSLIGGMLANSLARNANFQRNQQSYGGGRPTAAISQPANRTTTAKSQPRSGFFGSSSGGTSSSSSSSSFGG
jgi:hypothetical protein